jgi:hypothetical protein
MTREHLWALLALVIAIGLSYVLVNLTKDVQGQAQVGCADEKTKEHIRELTLNGIDDGFRKHIGNLFTIWVQDAQDQPRRAKVGLQNGVTAYLRAQEDTLKWAPPTCESHK